jgi:hypothetical protein
MCDSVRHHTKITMVSASVTLKIKTARVLAKRADRIVPVAVCQHPRTMSPRGSESARLWVHQQSMIAPTKTRFQPMREIVQRMFWHE